MDIFSIYVLNLLLYLKLKRYSFMIKSINSNPKRANLSLCATINLFNFPSIANCIIFNRPFLLKFMNNVFIIFKFGNLSIIYCFCLSNHLSVHM